MFCTITAQVKGIFDRLAMNAKVADLKGAICMFLKHYLRGNTVGVGHGGTDMKFYVVVLMLLV
jgi:hypothetical protein